MKNRKLLPVLFRLIPSRGNICLKQSVTIRIATDILESYKTMGDGYTGIMADVLKYAVNNPGVMTNAIKTAPQ